MVHLDSKQGYTGYIALGNVNLSAKQSKTQQLVPDDQKKLGTTHNDKIINLIGVAILAFAVWRISDSLERVKKLEALTQTLLDITTSRLNDIVNRTL